jgi:hypothetical protein
MDSNGFEPCQPQPVQPSEARRAGMSSSGSNPGGPTRTDVASIGSYRRRRCTDAGDPGYSSNVAAMNPSSTVTISPVV